jgi:ligand-binding sensor domain-containing protein
MCTISSHNERTSIINAIVKIFYFSITIILASCEKEIFIEPKSSSEHVSYCSAYINSNPAGAQIYVDNKYSGRLTPDTVKWLAKGDHDVRLRFNAVLDTVFKMQTDYSSLNSVYIDYFATFNNYGSIYCKSVPSSANIYLNKQLTDKFTNDTLKYLLPGDYEIRYYHYGFRDDSVTVKVSGGKTVPVNLTLQDTSEWIDYRTVNSAIPSNNIVAFKVDKINNIWIATFNNGLSKFTNQKFTNYTKSNSGLPSDFVTCLAVDQNNVLWVGTMEGLARFDGVNWKQYTIESGLPSNYITALYCDTNGDTYVGTKMGLSSIYEGYVFERMYQSLSLLKSSISSITGNNTGSLWVATTEGIAACFDKEWQTFTKEKNGLLGYEAGHIGITSNGTVWCAFPENPVLKTPGGLMKYEAGIWSEFALSKYIKNELQRVFIDARDNVWLATSAGIYVIWSDGSVGFFAGKQYAMFTSDVRDVLVDKKNKVWFALWGGGIVKCKLKML